jgi:hypothetical protein
MMISVDCEGVCGEIFVRMPVLSATELDVCALAARVVAYDRA